MSNKKVLIVTYYWPPSGGAAVQRWLSFANKLAERGWEVHLLTVNKRYATYQLWDESLCDQINKKIHIYTTKTFEPFGLYKMFFGKNSIPKPAFSNESSPSFLKKVSRFIRGNFFIPDPRKGWKRFAVPKALEIIKQHHVKNIITAGPPHSTHFIGKKIKELTGIKWIADFHDLWTDVIYYNMLYHIPFVKKWDLQLEKNILESADVVVTVGEKYKQKLLTKSRNLNPAEFRILRIGYDEMLFQSENKKKKQSEFSITYTGSIADFYEPQVLIYALKNIMEKYPEVPVRIRFVGVLSGGIKNEIIKSGFQHILKEEGYVSHAASIQYLKEATVLLLVNPVTKDEEMVIPGKLYEYLAAQKPIINITTKKAETADIIEACSAGKTFNRTEQGQLEEHLIQLIEEWKVSKNLDITVNETLINKYSRKEICSQLETVLAYNETSE